MRIGSTSPSWRSPRCRVHDAVDRSGRHADTAYAHSTGSVAVAGGRGDGRRRRRDDQRRLGLAHPVPRAEQPGSGDLDLPAVRRHRVRRASEQVPPDRRSREAPGRRPLARRALRRATMDLRIRDDAMRHSANGSRPRRARWGASIACAWGASSIVPVKATAGLRLVRRLPDGFDGCGFRPVIPESRSTRPMAAGGHTLSGRPLVALAGGDGDRRRRRRDGQRRLDLAHAVPRAEQPGGDDVDLPAVHRHGFDAQASKCR